MVPFLDRIVEFIGRCITDKHRNTAVLKSVVGLLGDLGHSFGARMRGFLSNQYVQAAIQEAMEGDDNLRTLAVWTQQACS